MLKPAISIGTAAAMAIGLCVCGKSEADVGVENAGHAPAGENVDSVTSVKFLKPKN